MQKTIIHTLNWASFTIVALSFQLPNMLLHFFIAGEIIGTPIVLSPNSMFIVLLIILFTLILWLTPIHLPSRQYRTLKTVLPKQRYVQLHLFDR